MSGIVDRAITAPATSAAMIASPALLARHTLLATKTRPGDWANWRSPTIRVPRPSYFLLVPADSDKTRAMRAFTTWLIAEGQTS